MPWSLRPTHGVPRRLHPLAGLLCRVGLVSGALGLLAMPALAEIYTVKRGDTLSRIAARFGCDQTQLRASNGMATDALQLGQSLQIPPGCLRGGGRTDPKSPSEPAHAAETGRAQAPPTPGPRVEPLGDLDELGEARLGALGRPVVGGSGNAGGQDDSAWVETSPLTARPDIDSNTLGAAMRARGFEPAPAFKALVIEITLDDTGDQIESERIFDFDGTGRHTDWNPASTVKLFAAIGALEYTASRGIATQAEVTFQDARDKAHTQRLDDIVEAALIESDNIAYDRLVQLAGYDFLNQQCIINQLGLRQTALNRPYARHTWTQMTGLTHFRDSPPLLVARASRGRRGKTIQIPPRTGQGEFPCERTAACTSLADLAEAMRRVMLFEQLAPAERPRFGKPELRLLRAALKAVKKRGNDMVDALRPAFRRGVSIYHKPGFAGSWMSDVAYLRPRNSNKRYVVAMAAYPGRTSVAQGARVLGQVIANGELH